jgi:hypothetical protein
VLLLAVGTVLLIISAACLINYLTAQGPRQRKALAVLQSANRGVTRIAFAF